MLRYYFVQLFEMLQFLAAANVDRLPGLTACEATLFGADGLRRLHVAEVELD